LAPFLMVDGNPLLELRASFCIPGLLEWFCRIMRIWKRNHNDVI
jgi:hypothetical protein